MALCSKKALVQFIYHVRHCLLQEMQQLSDSHQANVALDCGRVATKPPAHLSLTASSEGGAGLIQGERDGGREVPPLHAASASIFLLCSKLCHSHLSSILPTASSHSVSPLLLLPMEFLHFETLNFIHEKNQKISYACSQKNFGFFFCS